MISVLRGTLLDVEVEGVIRPVQSDFSPVSAPSRDLGVRAGERIEERLARLGTLPPGGAVITPGGDLPSDFIIHVVVCSADEPQTSATIHNAVHNALRRAADMDLTSLALPPLGIGVGLTEPEEAARSLCRILLDHLNDHPMLDITVVVSSTYEEEMFRGIVAAMSAERRDHA